MALHGDLDAASPLLGHRRPVGHRKTLRRRGIAAAFLIATCAAACTSGTAGTPAARPAPGIGIGIGGWSVVTPPDLEPTTLTVVGDTVLVGGASADQKPGLALQRSGSWQQVPVTPATGYGAQATLVHLAADPDGRVVGIGTATGGAHLNPRWTAWIGSIDAGIAEEPQTVETFGGPDAGGITALTGGADPLVIGTWSLSAGGLTVATWRHAGAVWEREAGTKELSGTGDAQTTATAAAARTAGTVIVGLETSLPGGTVHQQGVAWTRPRGGAQWTRINLDASTVDSAATDVACSGDSCVIVGQLGDELAAWRLTGNDVTPLTGVPERRLDRYAGQPRVAVHRAPAVTAMAVTGADGSSTVMVCAGGADPGGADPGDCGTVAAPDGEIRQITLTGDAVQLLVRERDGRQAVFAGR